MTHNKFCEISQLLQTHLQNIPVSAITVTLNCDNSRVSHIKSGEIKLSFDEFCRVISMPSDKHRHGLKVCDRNSMVISRDHLLALKTLARDALDTIDSRPNDNKSE